MRYQAKSIKITKKSVPREGYAAFFAQMERLFAPHARYPPSSFRLRLHLLASKLPACSIDICSMFHSSRAVNSMLLQNIIKSKHGFL